VDERVEAAKRDCAWHISGDYKAVHADDNTSMVVGLKQDGLVALALGDPCVGKLW